MRNVARNLTDEEIRCIAKTGGVIGLNFCHLTAAVMVRRMWLVLRTMQIIGKNRRPSSGGHRVRFRWIHQKTRGLENAAKIPSLWDELKKRGWTDEQLAGVRGELYAGMGHNQR